MRNISVDSEGADLGFAEVLSGCLKFVQGHDDARLTIYVLEENMSRAIEMTNGHPLITLVPAKFAATTDLDAKSILHDVRLALQNEKPHNYSMAAAIYDSISGRSDACLLPGHVGHAVFIARSIEKQLGIFNPNLVQCLMTTVPSVNRVPRIMLDLGGVINQDLFKLSLMGEAFVRHCLNVERPKVGFLNIGSESSKGKPEIKDAAIKYRSRMPESLFSKSGFIEPHEVYGNNDCNVVVCDGFLGNCVLKASEGVFRSTLELLHICLAGIPESAEGAVKAALQTLRSYFDPETRNVAIILGVSSLIAKCHGRSTANGVYYALVNTCSFIDHFTSFREELTKLFAHEPIDTV